MRRLATTALVVCVLLAGCGDPSPDAPPTDLAAGTYALQGTTWALVTGSDSGVFAVGDYQVNGVPATVVRLNDDRSLPTAFALAAIDTGFVERAFIADDETGDLILTGTFTAYGTVPAHGLVRLAGATGDVVAAHAGTPLEGVVTSGDGSGAVFAWTSDRAILRLDEALVQDPSFAATAEGDYLFGTRDGGVIAYRQGGGGASSSATRFDSSGVTISVPQPHYIDKVRGITYATDGTGDMLLAGVFWFRSEAEGSGSGVERLTSDGAVVEAFSAASDLGLSQVHMRAFFPASDDSGDLWAWSLLGPFGGRGVRLVRMDAFGRLVAAWEDIDLVAIAPAKGGGLWVATDETGAAGGTVPLITRRDANLDPVMD